MNRRQFFASSLGAMSALTVPAWAADEAGVVGSAKIIEALNPKDIVLDSRPGAPPRRSNPPSPRIALQVPFTFGSAELAPQGKRQLDELAMALNDNVLSSVNFEIAGHTDAVGDATSNLRLSLERADTVKQYLVAVHGLAPARLLTIGHGFSRLANPGNPQAAVNRRVEVRRLTRSETEAAARAAPQLQPARPPGGRLVPTPPQ